MLQPECPTGVGLSGRGFHAMRYPTHSIPSQSETSTDTLEAIYNDNSFPYKISLKSSGLHFSQLNAYNWIPMGNRWLLYMALTTL